MAVGYSRYLKTIYAVGDILLLNITFCLVSFYFQWPHVHADPFFLVQFLYINPFWAITTFFTGIHRIDRGLRYEQIVSQLFKGFALFSILMIGFLYFFENIFIPVYHFEVKLAVYGIVFFVWRSTSAILISFIRRRGLNYRKVIIIGNGAPAREMSRYFLTHPEVGYQLQGIFCDDSKELKDITGKVSEAKKFAIQNKIDEIYCSLDGLAHEQIYDFMEFADRSLIRFRMVPDFRGFLNKKVQVDFYDSVPVLSVRNEPLQNHSNRVVKRAFDIVFSFLVLILIFPFFMLIIAPLIKLSSKGPIFFKQMRSGRDNETFYCYKFRTMQVNDDADTVQAQKGDARITLIGKFLRKTSLDELPQFYNVFIGNMSVVGPRPHMLKHTQEYSTIIDKFMVRHLVKPGITGWAQVFGLRGETRDPVLMEKRVQYDVWYLENWSIILDVKIIVLTITQIVTGKINGG